MKKFVYSYDPKPMSCKSLAPSGHAQVGDTKEETQIHLNSSKLNEINTWRKYKHKYKVYGMTSS